MHNIVLGDMAVYDIEGLRAERDQLKAFIDRAESGERVAQVKKMQTRYHAYEAEFFSLVNEFKHKSLVA